jgi:integrase
MRRNLTIKAIEALKPAPSGGRYDIADAIVPGFGVRVTDKGKKSYILTARFPGSSNPTRRTIADVGAMELTKAREVARVWLSQIAAGLDPQAERERARLEAAHRLATFGEVVQQFMTQHVRRNALRSGDEIDRLLKKDVLPVWRDREFVSIRRGGVARLLDEIEARAPVHADHVLAILSKLFNWYMAREENYQSPVVRGMRRTAPKDHARSRVLADDEIRLFWAASADAGTYGAFLRVALLTAQRRSKVVAMRWSDIDSEGVWTIPAEPREKTNAGSLKLSKLALSIIEPLPRWEDCDFVFAGRGKVPINGLSKAKTALDEAMAEEVGAPVANWTVHDLRRTARSLMSRAGVRPDVSERVLGHAIPGVEGVYDRYSYDREKGEALAELAGLVTSIIEGKSPAAEVIRLPRAESANRPGSRPSAPPQPRSIQRHAR